MRISAKSALSPKREDAQKLKIHVSEKANFFVKSCENLTLTKMIKFEYGNLVPRTHTHKRNSPGSPAYKKRGEIKSSRHHKRMSPSDDDETAMYSTLSHSTRRNRKTRLFFRSNIPNQFQSYENLGPLCKLYEKSIDEPIAILCLPFLFAWAIKVAKKMRTFLCELSC